MGAVAPGCLRRLGLRGPLPSSMKHPWSDPCDFRAERVVRITEWGPRHLGGSGACGLWVFQVVRCTQSPGWRGSGPGRWVRADLVTICSEGFHIFSSLEGIHELFHFNGAKESLLLGLGSGSTIQEFKCT